MSKALVIASIAWPLLLGGAWYARAHTSSSIWPALVYDACSRICHQRPLRSFHTAGVQWPVCARCSGLYAAAGVGAIAAAFRRRPVTTSARVIVAVAAVPTALTLVLEWTALAPMTNGWRFGAALPLGMAIGFVLVTAVRPAGRALAIG